MAAHELMHALGYFHHHERADRDNYVTITDPSISNICDSWTCDIQGMDYDFGSNMHYGDRESHYHNHNIGA